MQDLAEAKRNRFFRGKRMQADEFSIEQSYGIERRRLINRTVIGWGVVAGFELTQPGKPKGGDDTLDQPVSGAHEQPEVSTAAELETTAEASTDATVQAADASPDQQGHPKGAGEAYPPEPYPLVVGRGFALDEAGREVACDEAELNKTNTFLLVRDKEGLCARDLGKLEPGDYILAVHYAEEKSGAVVPAHICGCGHPERGFVTETAVFSLRPRGESCGCGDPRCTTDGADCYHDACTGDVRGPHARLDHWVNKRDVGGATHLHCWDRYDVALHEGVDLACVRLEPADRDCDPLRVVIEDASGPRRLVKNNDLLFDLIRGCDLTRISAFSWHGWHREWEGRVPWSDFRDRIVEDSGDASGFTVTFSGPVLTESLRRDVFVMTAYISDLGTGWRHGYRVPVSRLDPTPTPGKHLPPGTTDRFHVIFDDQWIRDEVLSGRNSLLAARHFYVEIEVRAGLIKDCSGLLVAGAEGHSDPGNTFLSTFRVEKKRFDDKEERDEA